MEPAPITDRKLYQREYQRKRRESNREEFNKYQRSLYAKKHLKLSSAQLQQWGSDLSNISKLQSLLDILKTDRPTEIQQLLTPYVL